MLKGAFVFTGIAAREPDTGGRKAKRLSGKEQEVSAISFCTKTWQDVSCSTKSIWTLHEKVIISSAHLLGLFGKILTKVILDLHEIFNCSLYLKQPECSGIKQF